MKTRSLFSLFLTLGVTITTQTLVTASVVTGDHADIGSGHTIAGIGSTITGGTNNTATDDFATVSGGEGNSVTGEYSFIGSGQYNQVNADWSAVGSGTNNLITGNYSFIGSGFQNVVLHRYGAIAGGYYNQQDGDAPFIGGGGSNTNLGNWASIVGGLLNRNSGDLNTIGGGQYNNLMGDSSVIAGGEHNTNSGSAAFIGGGFGNVSTTAGWTVIAGGFENLITETPASGNSTVSAIGGGGGNWILESAGSTIGGGGGNSIRNCSSGTIGGGGSNIISTNAHNATIPGGAQAKATHVGQHAYASGDFATEGDAQTSVYVARNTTTTATPTDLYLDGSGARMTIANNTTWTFDIQIAARSTGNDSAGYHIEGVIENDGGTTAFVGTPTVTTLGENVPAWDAAVIANNVADALVVQVTGANSTTIRWVATVHTTEVSQ